MSTPTITTTAADISRLIRDLRRILRARLRQEFGGQPLPGPAVELLRLAAEQPGLRVGEAAKALRIAPNTTSTLVRQLTAAGLIDRIADDTDGRVARLSPTKAGRERLRTWRDQREALIASALATLAPGDLAAIEAAVPALHRLAHALEDRETASPSA
jgi:DNA-binding MarR family transcriptional regulator